MDVISRFNIFFFYSLTFFDGMWEWKGDDIVMWGAHGKKYINMEDWRIEIVLLEGHETRWSETQQKDKVELIRSYTRIK